jgi:outer membrane cobalamin receptor
MTAPSESGKTTTSSARLAPVVPISPADTADHDADLGEQPATGTAGTAPDTTPLENAEPTSSGAASTSEPAAAEPTTAELPQTLDLTSERRTKEAATANKDKRKQAPQDPESHGDRSRELDDLDLAALMDLKVTLSTKTEQTQEEAPSIMSVISRHDIEAYGARDLSDILRLVPGMEFGSDAYGLVGLGQRGLWAHEGKVLVMLNGMALNDGAYGTLNYFGTYPAAMIERVEIIRGPGSAVYGGFAELGVINVVTRSGAALNGAKLEGSFGIAGNDPIGTASAAGGVNSGDVAAAIHLGRSYSVLSSEKYADFFGTSADGGRKYFPRDWTSIIVELTYRERFKLNAMHNNFDFGGQDAFGAAVPKLPYVPLQNNKRSGVMISYEIPIRERFSIEPKAEYYQGNMITTPGTPKADDNVFATPYIDLIRYRVEAMAKYRHNAKISALLGGGYLRDTVRQLGQNGEPGIALPDGSFRFSTHSHSAYVYAQYLHSISIVGLTLGARYENTTFGDAFSPRAGVVLNKGRFTTKFLYGRAFRIPTPFQAYSRLQEIGYLKPELSDTSEVQFAYQITKHLRVKTNAFLARVQKPIQWLSSTNSYQNYGKANSVGAEAEVEARFDSFGGFVNASYARPTLKTSQQFMTLDEKNFIGLPPAKVTGGGYYRYRALELAPSLVFLSERYGQSQNSALSENGALGTTSYPALLLANLSLNWRDVLGLKGTRVVLSGYNILGAKYVLIQPYYGAHAPMRAQDRSFRLQIEVAL